MFRNRDIFPLNTPSRVINSRGWFLDLWIMRREDEIEATLWKRLFG